MVGVWGVKGWIKIHSYTENRGSILDHKIWFLGDKEERYQVLASQVQGQKIVASLDGITSREEALRCIGKTISVPVTELPLLQDGEFYWMQIEGLEAVDTAGQTIGVVDRLLETGANDVLVIRANDKEMLVPYLPGVVHRVDLESGVIELNWENDS